MEEGEIQVDSIQPIGLPDITPELARESGFLGVLDLLKVAKHGRGENPPMIGSYGGTACSTSPAQRQTVVAERIIFHPESRYGLGIRRAREGACWLPGFGSPQLLRSSLGAPAGGVLVVLSMQGIALKYS